MPALVPIRFGSSPEATPKRPLVRGASGGGPPSGCPAVPVANTKTIDGTVGGQFSNTNTGTVILTTSQNNDVVVLLYYHESNSYPTETIVSVTSPNLTWTKRVAYTYTIGGNPWDFEIWWAPTAVPLVAEVITIALTGTIDNSAYHAFGVHGSPDYTSPWDDCVLASAQISGGPASSQTTPQISTSSTGAMVIGFTGMANLVTPIIPPAGATPIRAGEQNNGGVLFAWLTSFYQNYSVQVTNVSYTTTPTSGTPFWGVVIDVLE